MKPLNQYELRYVDAENIDLCISLNVIENELKKEYSVLFSYDSLASCNKFFNEEEEFIKEIYGNLDKIYENEFLRSKLQVPIKLSKYIITDNIINSDPLYLLDGTKYEYKRNGYGYIDRIYVTDEITNELVLNTGIEYNGKTLINYNEDFKDKSYILCEVEDKKVIKEEHVIDNEVIANYLLDYDDINHECKIYKDFKAGQTKYDDNWKELYGISYKTGHSFDNDYISCINKRIYIDNNRYIELTKTNYQY